MSNEEVVPLIPAKITKKICSNVEKLIRDELSTVEKHSPLCKGIYYEEVTLSLENRSSKYSGPFSMNTMKSTQTNFDYMLEPRAAAMSDTYKQAYVENCIHPMDIITEAHGNMCSEDPVWADYIPGLPAEKQSYQYKSQTQPVKKSKKILAPPPSCDLSPKSRVTQKYINFAVSTLQCVPSELYFHDFNVGNEYTKRVQLFNLTHKHLRFTVIPPCNYPIFLSYEGRINGGVASGRNCKLYVKFIPKDLKPFKCQIVVKDAQGQVHEIAVHCSLNPVQLHFIPRWPSFPIEGANQCECLMTSQEYIHMGTCLLGEMIRFDFNFHSGKKINRFFILSEEEWNEGQLKENKYKCGHVIANSFVIYPAYFECGSKVEAHAIFLPSCCQCVEVYDQTFYVISSNVVARKFSLKANVVIFDPELIHLRNLPKNYPIYCDSDENCEYYINLGAAYIGKSLAKTFQVQNDSLINLRYSWKLRRWNYLEEDETVSRVTVTPSEGILVAQSVTHFEVSVYDVGQTVGDFRCAVTLTLHSIPVSSLPDDYECVKAEDIETLLLPPPLSAFEACACQTFTDIKFKELEIGYKVEKIRLIVEPCVVSFYRLNRLAGTTPFTARVTNCGLADNKPLDCHLSAPFVLIDEPSFPLDPGQTWAKTFTLDMSALQEYNEIIISVNNGDYIKKIIIRIVARMEEKLGFSFKKELNWDILGIGRTKDYPYTVINKTNSKIGFRLRAFKRTVGQDGKVTAEEEDLPKHLDLYDHEKRKLTYTVRDLEVPGLRLDLLQLYDEHMNPMKAEAELFTVRTQLPVVRLHVVLPDVAQGDDEIPLDEFKVELDRGDSKTNRFPMLRCSRPLLVGEEYGFQVALTNHSVVPCNFSWETEFQDALIVKFEPITGKIDPNTSIVIQTTLKAECDWTRRLSLRECHIELNERPLFLLIDTEAILERPKPLPCLED